MVEISVDIFHDVQQYLESHQGQVVSARYSMNELGTWLVREANDGTATHQITGDLGYFTCTLAELLNYLVATKPSFRGAYNSWGSIEKITTTTVTPELTKQTLTLMKRAKELEAELLEIKKMLGRQ